MLDIYKETVEQVLAVPVVTGRKTEKEKFAGAEETYTIEALMHDGKALQSGTSHYFGQGFAKAFGMKFLDKDNQQKYVYQTSWGVSTRLIGAIIMVHGDDNGLVLPPRVAPIQVRIVPIQQKKEGVLDKAYELLDALKAAGIRADIDASDKNPGFKFAEAEMRGIPVRIELGPKDIENNQSVVAKRNDGEKITKALDEVVASIPALLDQIHDEMFAKAKAHLEAHQTEVFNMEDFVDVLENKTGYVEAPWCGETECELKIKEQTTATTRCIKKVALPGEKCVCCGKEAKHRVYFAKAY